MLVWLRPTFGDFLNFQSFPLSVSLSSFNTLTTQLSRVGHRVHMSHHHQDTIPVSVHVCLWASHLIPPPCSQPRNPISHTRKTKRAFYLPNSHSPSESWGESDLAIFPFVLFFSFPCLSHLSIRCKLWRVGQSTWVITKTSLQSLSLCVCELPLNSSTTLHSKFNLTNTEKAFHLSIHTLQVKAEARVSFFSFFLPLSPTLPSSHVFSAIQLWRLGFSVHMSHHEDTIGVSVHVCFMWAFTWSLHAIQSHEPRKEHFICQFTLSKWKLSSERVLFLVGLGNAIEELLRSWMDRRRGYGDDSGEESGEGEL
jgi:hypothetical protein